MTYLLDDVVTQLKLEGASAPTYQTILAYMQQKAQQIFGSDIYIDPDSQDGQLLAIFSAAINDVNQLAVAVINAFSPTYAQGVGLSSLVKINGIARQVASYSSAVGTVTGVAGTVIVNGVVKDENNNLWSLPPTVLIPTSGAISVTVTAQEAGAITALAGTINAIQTPVYGWQSFLSTSDATPGNPVESDAALRIRQAASTMVPAQTPLGALTGQIAKVQGVTKSAVYENAGSATDGNGLPGHSICVVAQGGAVQDIIDTIGANKTPGVDTFGSTSGTYTDPVTAVEYTLNYDVMVVDAIGIKITLHPLDGWNSTTEALIQAALADYINSLKIGQSVVFSRLWGAAYLNGDPLAQTYNVTSLQTNLNGGTYGTTDIAVAFNAAASCDEADIAITLS